MLLLQKTLSVKKDKSAGRYKYRSLDEIYEKIKEVIDEPLRIKKELRIENNMVFVCVTAKYKDVESQAFVEVDRETKTKSIGQAYGEAQTYAVKYALCDLFLIDSGEDLDRTEEIEQIARDTIVQKLKKAGLGDQQRKEFKEKYYDGSGFKKWLDRVDLDIKEFLEKN